MALFGRTGALSLNLLVPKEANLKIDWFHCVKIQKSNGSIAPFSKFEWFHGTTGTTTSAGPVRYQVYSTSYFQLFQFSKLLLSYLSS